MKEEIKKEHLHPSIQEREDYTFIWNQEDSLCPFAAAEGQMALRAHRQRHETGHSTLQLIHWLIENVGEMSVARYFNHDEEFSHVFAQLVNPFYNRYRYIYMLDLSILATGFAQWIEEGQVDKEVASLMHHAIKRQQDWVDLAGHWNGHRDYKERLKRYESVLKNIA